jgi:putative peptide zinc metalloprotease protein
MDAGPVEHRGDATAGREQGAGAGKALSSQLVSSHWYRVSSVAPKLRETLRIHAQRWRGQLWYVVEDRINGKYHRFDRAAFRIIRLLDGRHTLEQLWQRLSAEAGEDEDDETPSQEDILALLGQLHTLDLLATDTVPDLAELSERQRTQARRKWMSRYLNPLAIRVPLLDPDKFLGRTVQALSPVLNRWGALAWLACVLPAIVLAASHWRELTGNATERLLAFDNLLLLAVAFPLVKALHELGHGIACKLRGGEVHDMGVMMLLFLPVPYVEASSSWTFPDKRDRMLVGAAGMLVEVWIAAMAFYLWLWLEPGVVKAIAYDVAVLASVTTVLFNGNPLLRYDGYFVASDALEIPNLAQRAGQWWGYVFERFLLARRSAVSPAHAPGEALWFAFYAPLSFAYRMFVMFSIAVFVATQYFAVGLLIAVWSVVMSLGLPLWKALKWLGRNLAGSSATLRSRRVVLATLATLGVLLFAIPLPHHTQVDGVLWLPDRAVLRAGQGGFVDRVMLASGAVIKPGDAVLRLVDPAVTARVQAQAARETAARVRYEAARVESPAAGEQYAGELRREEIALAHERAKAALLDVRAATGGRLWLARAEDMPGRHFAQGEVLGYVLPQEAPRVRVIVDQADESFIRSHTKSIRVKLPFAPERAWEARVVRAVPAASNDLPSAALGRQGGGGVAVDPRDESGRKALTTHFEYELALPDDFPYRLIGSRVSLRFEHPMEPLGLRMWRGVRRLFLGYFHT